MVHTLMLLERTVLIYTLVKSPAFSSLRRTASTLAWRTTLRRLSWEAVYVSPAKKTD